MSLRDTELFMMTHFVDKLLQYSALCGLFYFSLVSNRLVSCMKFYLTFIQAAGENHL
jgi:hypothetical protein